MRRLLLALGVALALAGCGGSVGASGDPVEPADLSAPVSVADDEETASAQLWVTRDRGRTVVLTASVPAGYTVLQALDLQVDIETRYGGRFVQSIEGIEGNLAEQQDWFYFVNGVEPDLGAAEVRLRPGDVAWWDFRSWQGTMQQPVVVGAFPEPFLHGFGAEPRPLEVLAPPELADAAEALRAVLAPADPAGEPNVFSLEIRGGVRGAELTASRGGANDSPVIFVLAGSEKAVRAAAFALARDPSLVRYRYAASFDAQGSLVE